MFFVHFQRCYVWKTDTLRKIIARIEAGDAMVQELCEFGDKLLGDETAKVFKKEKDMKKGTAWRLCRVLTMSKRVVRLSALQLLLQTLFDFSFLQFTNHCC